MDKYIFKIILFFKICCTFVAESSLITVEIGKNIDYTVFKSRENPFLLIELDSKLLYVYRI